MTAGSRDSLIKFEAATAAQDSYGEEISAWVSLGSAWAAIFWGRGDERRQAAMEKGEQAVVFQVLSSPVTRLVTIRNRITIGNDLFDIVGIAPNTPDRAHIEFTATRAL